MSHVERRPPAPVSFVGGRRYDGPASEGLEERAVAGAAAGFRTTRSMPAHARAAVLDGVEARLGADPGLAAELAGESELTLRDMDLEIARARSVFRLAASEVGRGSDEPIALDAVEAGAGRWGIVRRVPYGPVLGITPFNGPILTASHKAAPAIGCGAPIVLKPSPWVPHGAARLAELIVDAGWPADAIAVLATDDAGTRRLILDERLPVVSFTGGGFGWTLKELVPRKHVHLELGGVGSVIVCEDADLEFAAERCAMGGFVRSGQSCISVQLVLAVGDAYEPLVEALAPRVAAIAAGDPLDPDTVVGPLVSEHAADRATELVQDALSQGARVVAGGGREGRLVEPTLVAGADLAMRVACEEVFGPVVVLVAVPSLGDAVQAVNGGTGALHVGIFTQDIDAALAAFSDLDAGAVIVNDVNTWRVDHMPYGGVRGAGFGREGIRYAMDEMTQTKVLAVNHRPRDIGTSGAGASRPGAGRGVMR